MITNQAQYKDEVLKIAPRPMQSEGRNREPGKVMKNDIALELGLFKVT